MALQSIEVKPFLNESNCNLRVNIHAVVHAKYIFLCPFVPTSSIPNKVNSVILTTKKINVVNPHLVCVFCFLLTADYKIRCRKF